MVALIPFLLSWIIWLFGLSLSRLAGVPLFSADPRHKLIFSYAFFTLVVLVSIMVIAAWVRGFPTWSYTTGFLFFVFSLYLTNASVPGLVLFSYHFERQLLGPVAMLPLGVVVIVSLFLTRKNPSRPFLADMDTLSQNMSRLSFSLFGLMPFFLRLVFDKVSGEDVFVRFLDLFLGVCALVYLRARRGSARGRRNGRRAAAGHLGFDRLSGYLLGWTPGRVDARPGQRG